ncbi:MAG: YdcF family protein [Phycisphaera sp. RhM]|nr:YdcF family protein [Phycisphaera sp. RhM]
MADVASKWKRRFWLILIAWAVVTLASSFASVRGVLIQPLYVHDGNARGEIAYVMADGPAYWERLFAASDLYHFHRVEQIYLLEELNSSSYNFVRRQNDTRLQRAIDYLAMRGVPADVIHSVPVQPNVWLGSRSEAAGVANLPHKFTSIVVVTSPPHTRRSKLCFQREFGDAAEISVYSATSPGQSVETHFPIWLEYAKLVVYWFWA